VTLTSDWLGHLYDQTDTGWLTLFAVDRTTGERITKWHRIIDHDWAADEAAQLAETCCVWFGVAPRERKLPAGKRGGAGDCLTLPAMWLDIDIASAVHAADDLPPDIDAALELLSDFPIPPTAVINSGHGLQAWWKLSEPIDADEQATQLLADWGTTWAEIGRRRGWHVDNVFDIARVMRLPGTLNRKADPVPVTIIGSDWTRTYGIDDLAGHMLEAPKPQAPDTRRDVPYIGPERPGDAYNAVTDGAAVLERAGFHFDHQDSDGSRHYRAPHRTERNDTTGATVYADGHTTLWSETFARNNNMDTRRPYDAYGLFTHIEHRGDWAAASRALRAEGYGSETIDLTDNQNTTATVLELPDAPQPLESSHRSGPAFPLDTLPQWISDQCREVASAFQVPADLPAMLALGSLSTILTGHVKVNLTGSKWTEHVNLYLVSALLPGSGKSPVFKAMTKPVNEVEAASLATAKDRLREWALRKRVLEGQAKTKEAEAIKATDNSGMAFKELLDITKALEDLPAPGAGRLVAEDITPEALVEALAANDGRISLMSSEGGVFDMMAGQYVDKGKATNLAVYLQGWSADSIRRQRTKGAELVIDEALITMCVTTQPGVIGALGANRELVTKGVPVRFMYSVPPSLVGYRDRNKVFQSIDNEIDARYQSKMTGIGLDVLGAPTVTLQLDPQATARFTQWDQNLEDRQRPGGDLAERAEWAAKLRATVLRVSAILHTANAGRAEVGIDRVEEALTIAAYWMDHANIVEKMWADDHVTSRARAIVRWALDTGKHQFSLRDVTSKRGTFPTADDAVAPLQELIDKGWVVAEQAGPVEVTGRGVPSQRFCLRSDADEWLRATAQPAQPPKTDEVARVARVVHGYEFQTHSLSTHNIDPSEKSQSPAQPAQPAQLAPTGTDDLHDYEPI
jgi:hypothetical protein